MTRPDLATLVDSDHTVLVTQECQNGVIGDGGPLPQLAEAAQRTVVPNGGRLLAAARAAGVDVVHCVAARRADGGVQHQRPPVRRGAQEGRLHGGGFGCHPGRPGARSEDTDVILSRLHGIGPMGGTDLDAVLRNLGASTIVGIGVSVNLGMTFAMDAVNAGTSSCCRAARWRGCLTTTPAR